MSDVRECDDYEYDLVHDELQVPGQPSGGDDPAPAGVDLATGELGGDYGYDMAHDDMR